MLSVLWQILPLLLVFFLLGWLVMGWLTFRWRRTEVSGAEWEELSSKASRFDSFEVDVAAAEKLEADYQATVERVGLLEAEMATSKAQAEAAEGRLAELDQQLEADAARSNELESELSAAQRRAEDLDQQLGDAKRASTELSERLESEVSRAALLDEEMAEIRERQRVDLDNPLGLLPELEIADDDDTETRLVKTQDAYGAAKGRVAELTSMVSSGQAQMASLETEIAEVRTRADSVEGELVEARRELGSVDSLRERVTELESELATAASRTVALEAELVEARTPVEEPEDVPEVEPDAVLAAELTESKQRVAGLEATVTAVQGLAQVKEDELKALRSRVSELEAELVERRLSLADAEAEIAGLKANSSESGSQADSEQGDDELQRLRVRVASLTGQLDESQTRIASLEAKPSAPSWSAGTTELGTPGAAHVDDLKVIKGIGQKMESVLKSFGIQTWDQLAAFTDDDVAAVSEAIDTFPGRIERDEWVAQAKALVERYPDVDNRPSRDQASPPPTGD